jgi:anti-sigma factor ChrR (cupin superfamily)
MTQDELNTEIDDKIDVTGRRLTTGARTRQVLKEIVSSIFGQFPQVYKVESVTLTPSQDYTITVPSSTYSGAIKGVQLWTSSGVIVNSVNIRRGTSGSDKTVILNSGKGYTNLEVNILIG